MVDRHNNAVDPDLSDLEQQLAAMAVGGDDAGEVLARLAEAVFPGGVGIGDPARLMWPEQAAGAGPLLGATENDLEAHIRKSESRFRSLVEQLPAVVFYAALGSDENEAYVSPQIESLLGFTQAEWLTNPLLWFSQLHPDDHDTVIEAFTKGVQTGQPFRAEVRFFSRSGEEVWILGEARLIRDDANRPAYFQGVAFDITMTKRAQVMFTEAARAREEAAQVRADAIASRNARLWQLNKELLVAKEEAEAAAHARTTFLTTMSHELRTPLNSVIVLAGLLADGELTPGQLDMVRRMRLASDHLLELINDVLEFSRLRAGHVELDLRSFDLQAWLDDTVEIVAPRAGEKGLELRLTVGADVPRVLRADQGRLRQVLLNLLGNAVKFTARGSVAVEVSAAPLAPGRWEYQCSVRDSGIGIKPEDAVNLFDEFRQADSGISREFGGTGLGLAICKRLCDLLGGRIWVEDSDGPGATVSFTWIAEADGTSVPAAGSPMRSSALWHREIVAGDVAVLALAASAPEQSGPDKLRVLIAEDNAMNQQVALLLLGAMGYNADVVGNGDEAIAAVRARAYDVVLMDIAMPGTDGISATRAIRALGAGVHQPYIVALTAHAFPGDAESCLAAGMDDYVAKPVERAQLARALTAGADRAAAGGAPARAGGAGAGGNEAPSGIPGPAPSPAPGIALDFDPTAVREIFAEFGPGPLRRLLAIFRPEATRLVEAARAAVAAGDAEAAERAAHTLKSSAANMGAFALQSSCTQLEARARAGSLEGGDALTAAMVRQLAVALNLLDTEVAATP
ncbi:MAG: two-component system, sensor histidine kinase and response regulator [Acidimicrobiaceae bacterium]|jgi:PAS domain S-box-containing protein|nr:two-component system, sensor histidine kinase and response regulator [Acidimicrobiaceae bacterium]